MKKIFAPHFKQNKVMEKGENMKKIKRAVHFDFHTMPGIEDFGAEFNADEFVKRLKSANVEYINMFARCNIGYSYYFTNIGTPYPTMKTDMAREVVKACKKYDMGITLYLNGTLNHQLMIDRPEFMKINKNGEVYSGDRVNYNFFRTLCFNTDYREYLISEINEILGLGADGIFVDCMIPFSCYCPKCIKKMKDCGIDISDDNEVFKFAVETLKSVFAEIRAVVPENVKLYINSYPYEDIHGYLSHAELECLPSGAWGYDYLAANAPYYRKFTNELVYMTGRFVSDWGDFGGSKSDASLENDVYDALLYGYTPSVGDHLHPVGRLDEKLYTKVGEIYGYVKELEKWTDNTRALTEAAIIRNKITSDNVRTPFSESDKGAARMLAELKICYDIINEDMDFEGYKLLVLPDKVVITEKLAKKLENFKGGILSSGKSFKKTGIWDFAEFYEDNGTDGFYKYKGHIYGQYSVGVKMKSNYGIAEYAEAYFRKEFDGLHGYFYNPPKKPDGYYAAVKKGNTAHIGFNIFEAYMKYGAEFLRDFAEDIINMLLSEKIICAEDLPVYSRVSVMQGKEYELLHVKSTFPEKKGERGIIDNHVILPHGVTVSVKGEFKNVFALPEKVKTESYIKDGRTYITLPEINGYKPFLLTDGDI